MTLRLLRSPLLAAAFCVTVVGCSSDDPVASYLVTERSRPQMPVAAEESMSGTLGVTSKGCVALDMSGDLLLLWAPFGSQLVDDGSAVELAGFGTFAIGDEVTLEGKRVEVGKPIQQNQPTNYDRCVAEAERRGVDVAIVAQVG